MSHVDLNNENKGRCRCPICPVEKGSTCSMKKLHQMEEGEDPSTQSLPEIYCSIGKSSCSDMQSQENCLCPSCPVWAENDLSNNHYCVKDRADKID